MILICLWFVSWHVLMVHSHFPISTYVVVSSFSIYSHDFHLFIWSHLSKIHLSKKSPSRDRSRPIRIAFFCSLCHLIHCWDWSKVRGILGIPSLSTNENSSSLKDWFSSIDLTLFLCQNISAAVKIGWNCKTLSKNQKFLRLASLLINFLQYYT